MTARTTDSPWRIGCDVASVYSVRQSIADFGDRYLDRIFTPLERSQSRDVAERLAARFAGKEAVLKLLLPHPTTAVPYRDIEIGLSSVGAPAVSLHGRAKNAAANAGLGTIAISLSHDAGVAFATAIATLSPPTRKTTT